MMRWLWALCAALLFLGDPAVVCSQEKGGSAERRGMRRRENGGHFSHSPRRSTTGKGRHGDPRARMKGALEAFEFLKTQDPERFKELMQLRDTDPDAFRKRLQEFLATRSGPGGGGRHWAGVGASEEKCRELAWLYHEAEDETEKEAISRTLLDKIEETFDLRQQGARERLERMEEEIAKIRSLLERRDGKRGKICKVRLEELTRDPALEWDTYR